MKLTCASHQDEQKEASKENGSVQRKKLLPVAFERVILPVLHIILGIVKKHFDELVAELRKVDSTDESGRTRLCKARDLITEQLDYFDAVAAELKKDLEDAEAAKKEVFTAYKEARGGEASVELLLKAQHQAACKNFQDLQLSLKVAGDNKLLISSARKLLLDLNGYLKKNQGRFERKLELLISNTPIAAQHNPFYAGAFNGNDCFRLIENHELVFKTLKECAKTRVDSSSDESTNNARAEEEKSSTSVRDTSLSGLILQISCLHCDRLKNSRRSRKTNFLMTSRPIGIPTLTIVVAVLPPSFTY
jgi:hypothetical protein